MLGDIFSLAASAIPRTSHDLTRCRSDDDALVLFSMRRSEAGRHCAASVRSRRMASRLLDYHGNVRVQRSPLAVCGGRVAASCRSTNTTKPDRRRTAASPGRRGRAFDVDDIHYTPPAVRPLPSHLHDLVLRPFVASSVGDDFSDSLCHAVVVFRSPSCLLRRPVQSRFYFGHVLLLLLTVERLS